MREPISDVQRPRREPVPRDRWDSVPRELKERDQWVAWRYIQRPGKEKPDKVPFNARTRGDGSSTNPATWSSYEDAVAASDAFDGIGFVLTADDPYVGVDLDHCVNGDGAISAEVQQSVDDLASYTEITPSGHGLRIFVRG